MQESHNRTEAMEPEPKMKRRIINELLLERFMYGPESGLEEILQELFDTTRLKALLQRLQRPEPDEQLAQDIIRHNILTYQP